MGKSGIILQPESRNLYALFMRENRESLSIVSRSLSHLFGRICLNKPDYFWIMMEFMQHNVESGNIPDSKSY